MECAMDMERLIENVYLYPILYDLTHQDYKNVKKRDRLWEVIAKEMGEPSDVLKKKWKNLRDSYMKFLLSIKTTTGQERKRQSTWKWATQMQRFKPFISSAKTSTNVSTHTSGLAMDKAAADACSIEDAEHSDDGYGNDFEGAQETENNNDSASASTVGAIQPTTPVASRAGIPSTSRASTPSTTIPSLPITTAKPQKKKKTEPTNTDKVFEYLKNRNKPDLDETDYLMLSYSKTIKKLSKRRQILAKRRINEIINDLEMEEVNDEIPNRVSYSTPYASGCSSYSHPSSSDNSNSESIGYHPIVEHNPWSPTGSEGMHTVDAYTMNIGQAFTKFH